MPIIVPSAVFVADASHGISPAWEQELRGVEDPDELQGESLDGVPRHAVRTSLGFRPLPMAVDSTRRKSLFRWQKRAAVWEHGFGSLCRLAQHAPSSPW
jgi:hypothetical protein